MKTRFICLLLLVCGFTFSTNAQDEAAKYKLRDPSAAEYMDGILSTMSVPLNFADPLFPQILGDILLREYPHLENEKWGTLLKVYDWLGVGESTLSVFYNRDVWNTNIIHSWLRENQIDLSKTKQFKFADYDIRVTPRDFDGNGENEYLLDVVKGATKKINRNVCNYDAEYVDYLVVQQNKGDYSITRPSSLPWHGAPGGGPIWLGQGGAAEIRFADINADGLPEWVVADGGEVGGGPGNYETAGELYIFSWYEGQLVDLTPKRGGKDWKPDQSPVYYEDSGGGCSTISTNISWDFVNVDHDPALEILQHQIYADNWSCDSVITKQFDWDADKGRYVYARNDQAFGDTQNCTQRLAEETMWKGDFAKAVSLFQKALTLPQREVAPSAKQYTQKLVQLNQYLRARLALAYILTQQPEKALPLITVLQTETFTDEANFLLVDALAKHVDNPFASCVAAYNVFAKTYPMNLYGITVEQYTGRDRPYLPKNMGCDAPKMIGDLFAKHSFNTHQLPVDQLNVLDLNTRKVLHFDLNHDGYDEWLIWLESPVAPFFFAPNGDTYQVSQVEINAYLEPGEISTWELPDGAGQTIIFKPDNGYSRGFPPWYGQYDWLLGLAGGGGSTCVTAGRKSPDYSQFKMWRLDNYRLVSVFDNQLCRDNVADLFPEGEGSITLDGGTVKYDDGYDSNSPTDLKYVWDNTKKIYDWPPNPSPTPIPTTIPAQQPKYYHVIDAFNARDYAVVVDMSSQLIPNDYGSLRPQMLTRDYYLRALALQHLGRDKEAIEAFLKMIDAAPDEHWKKLAMLYLEPV